MANIYVQEEHCFLRNVGKFWVFLWWRGQCFFSRPCKFLRHFHKSWGPVHGCWIESSGCFTRLAHGWHTSHNQCRTEKICTFLHFSNILSNFEIFFSPSCPFILNWWEKLRKIEKNWEILRFLSLSSKLKIALKSIYPRWDKVKKNEKKWLFEQNWAKLRKIEKFWAFWVCLGQCSKWICFTPFRCKSHLFLRNRIANPFPNHFFPACHLETFGILFQLPTFHSNLWQYMFPLVCLFGQFFSQLFFVFKFGPWTMEVQHNAKPQVKSPPVL